MVHVRRSGWKEHRPIIHDSWDTVHIVTTLHRRLPLYTWWPVAGQPRPNRPHGRFTRLSRPPRFGPMTFTGRGDLLVFIGAPDAVSVAVSDEFRRTVHCWCFLLRGYETKKFKHSSSYSFIVSLHIHLLLHHLCMFCVEVSFAFAAASVGAVYQKHEQQNWHDGASTHHYQTP